MPLRFWRPASLLPMANVFLGLLHQTNEICFENCIQQERAVLKEKMYSGKKERRLKLKTNHSKLFLLCHGKNHQCNFWYCKSATYKELFNSRESKKDEKQIRWKYLLKKKRKIFEKVGIRQMKWDIPTSQYMAKVNNKKSRKRFEICIKLTIKTP